MIIVVVYPVKIDEKMEIKIPSQLRRFGGYTIGDHLLLLKTREGTLALSHNSGVYSDVQELARIYLDLVFNEPDSDCVFFHYGDDVEKQTQFARRATMLDLGIGNNITVPDDYAEYAGIGPDISGGNVVLVNWGKSLEIYGSRKWEEWTGDFCKII
ncbi:hypothetical protein ACFLQN_04150 [Candidatus Aenigmatarchaeota archaeon]